MEPREKRILTDIVQDLVLRASAIAAVTSALDESLRKFVEGPEYARSKALAKLLSKAMGLAMEMRGRLNPVAKLSTALNLAPRKFRSVSQLVWAPKPPRTKPEPFRPAEESGADLKEIWEAVNIAEIDFQALKEDILAVLETRESASVAEVLDAFPARQGLASVIGLIHLAHRHGDKNSPARETAAWLSLDGFERSARIETWLFRRSRADELRKSVNDY